MTTLSPPKVIRRVRQRLQLSQEALSRVLSATKGAIQHWERGRNNPDLARLLALREICPPGPERKELDALVKQTQAQVARLESTLKKKIEQLRIIDNLVKDLQRELSALRGKEPEKSAAASGGPAASGAGQG